MSTIKIGLEWFLNPDHLPMVAGIVKGAYKEAGLDVQIVAPDDHYDGFKELNEGNIDIHCNEPLHLFEHHFDGLKSLGCFFETRGGVMIKQESIDKLRNNQPLRITTPASNEVTNTIGFEILKRYAQKEGFELDRENVSFIQNDFWHITNMKNDSTLDGAWLCFYNFEGIEAEYEQFDNLFIDQHISPYPNFSALEFMTNEKILHEKKSDIQTFISITNEMAEFCQNNIDEAKAIYYEYSEDEKSELMDAIIEDTIPRFETDIKPENNRWLELYNFLEELNIVKLSDKQYTDIW